VHSGFVQQHPTHRVGIDVVRHHHTIAGKTDAAGLA
jgi:hypothetical protein